MSVKSKPELEKESGSHFFGINKTWQRRLHCPFYLSHSLCLYLEFFSLFFSPLTLHRCYNEDAFHSSRRHNLCATSQGLATVGFCKFMFLHLNKSYIVRQHLKAIVLFFLSVLCDILAAGRSGVDILTIHNYLRSIRHLSWQTVGWCFSILACLRLTGYMA